MLVSHLLILLPSIYWVLVHKASVSTLHVVTQLSLLCEVGYDHISILHVKLAKDKALTSQTSCVLFLKQQEINLEFIIDRTMDNGTRIRLCRPHYLQNKAPFATQPEWSQRRVVLAPLYWGGGLMPGQPLTAELGHQPSLRDGDFS